MLFQPIKIKGMKLKNRVAFPPFLNVPMGKDGSITDLTLRWFEMRARGGAGLVVTGVVRPISKEQDFPMGTAGLAFYDDKFIPGFARLAEVVHAHGAKLGVQIGIYGVWGGRGMSPLPYPDEKHAKDRVSDIFAGFVPVKVVSVEEIKEFEEACAVTAARAKTAGVDCVELHYAHGGGMLHSNALSPFFNRRTDEYGGDWQRRLRFPIETLKKVRKAVGDDFPILVRINGDDRLGKRGITLGEATEIIAPALEAAGADCFDVSQGSMTHALEDTPPLYYPRGCFIYLAEAVKKVTRLPVIGVARIVDLDMAERFLQAGKADIIYMGRQLTADSDTPKKYFEGRIEDIRHCIGCAAGCISVCSVNYDEGNEPIPLMLAEKPKRVLVIGGGVGGMEAARIATLRGHKVTLLEKDSKLGGVVGALALDPLTVEFGGIVDFLTTQMRKLRVDVRLCLEATIADIEKLNPDVVILATGASPIVPEVARERTGMMTHEEALRRKREIGKRVIVWGFFGAELAISLAEEGREVVLMSEGGEGSLASDLPRSRRFWLVRKLTDVNVLRESPEAMRGSNPEVLFNVQVEEVTSGKVKIVEKDGKETVLTYDTLILSRRFGERQKNDSLFDELPGKVAEVYKIGDCLKVSDIKNAIWGANKVARKI